MLRESAQRGDRPTWLISMPSSACPRPICVSMLIDDQPARSNSTSARRLSLPAVSQMGEEKTLSRSAFFSEGIKNSGMTRMVSVLSFWVR